jgi:hypothetical protein
LPAGVTEGDGDAFPVFELGVQELVGRMPGNFWGMDASRRERRFDEAFRW